MWLKMKLETLKKLYQQEFTVCLYETINNKKPVLGFIKALMPKDKVKVLYIIELLSLFGNMLREPHSKHLKDNLFELRIKTSSNNERIFYCFIERKNCILLHGFTKKTKKTPQKELEIALERYEDLLKRLKKE